jgi:putative SOS response-associated peptidase YedK
VCGRFTLSSAPALLARHFDLEQPPDLAPRFNIAPAQAVATVRALGAGGKRVLELRRWGLVPRWAKDPKIGDRMINARAETVAEKPAFREAFRLRRCLVPADGFYEWAAGSPPRQPYHIRLVEGSPFGMAGLWERWSRPGGEAIESCTLLTTRANERICDLHDRMPVILEPESYDLWLDPTLRDAERLLPLLCPLPGERLAFHAVSRRVNDPRHDDPSCAAPLDSVGAS